MRGLRDGERGWERCKKENPRYNNVISAPNQVPNTAFSFEIFSYINQPIPSFDPGRFERASDPTTSPSAGAGYPFHMQPPPPEESADQF